ncbi:MAG: glutamine synthetase III [Bdellovibrionales bacterium]|nr:glutamine synthetase III [Bdellovibrionales bacterium]
MSHSSLDAQARFNAIQLATQRHPRKFDLPRDDLGRNLAVSDYFGSHTFGGKEIRASLSRSDLDRFQAAIHSGQPLEKDLADKIAKAVKNWALEMGVTHFCHWFQPMTGSTAEKHDAFISFGDDGTPIEKFSGSQLVQSEPDASSFPSGGMRSTFEARGYTAWDPQSPMFIMTNTNGKTLCIPSAFVSYTGHALDEKTPLLRAMEKISEKSVALLHLLGDTSVKRVTTTLGCEQEYFLVDRAYHSLRPDLLLAGRSLLGARPPKGQELEDHYFGSIPSRVAAFMQEVEFELYRLGVPAKTRHNEVAPAQFELAPIFEDANVAVDHNHLTMEVLKKVAERHNFSLLLHEKPFAGINGSGKHANWSLSTDTGVNLLDPGETPHQNLRFLTVLAAVLKGVHGHNGLLRASIASVGNDHRLGANEAPPAIMSVFLGDQLSMICNKIESGEAIDNPERAMISLGVAKIPLLARDSTDRNRTSPFAFTGNKFEFRAVGASASPSFPIACLNAAVAEAMGEMAERLAEKQKSGGDKDKATLELVRETIIATKAIRFEGNGYSPEWIVEAEKRGLSHFRNTPESIPALGLPSSKKLLTSLSVLSEAELQSRVHIQFERYVKKLEIEFETMRTLLDSYVAPAVSGYLADLAESVAAIAKVPGADKSPLESQMKKVSDLLKDLTDKRAAFESAYQSAASLDEEKKARAFGERTLPAMQAVRDAADRLEAIVGNSYWPLPKYREMLFCY